MPWSVPFQGIISFISSSQLHTSDLQSHTANLSALRTFFGKSNDPRKWKPAKNVAKGNKSVLTNFKFGYRLPSLFCEGRFSADILNYLLFKNMHV